MVTTSFRRPFRRMKIRFALRMARINGQGQCPIYYRLTKDGLKIPDQSTGLFCDPKAWQRQAQRVKGQDEAAQQTNDILDSIRRDLDGIYKDYLIRGTELTPAEVLNIYRGGDTVGQLAVRYLAILQATDRADGTIKRYRRSFDLLAEFVGDIAARHIQKKKAQAFWPWLYGKAYTRNYCNKVFQACRGLLDYAIREDHIEINPFAGIRLEWDGEVDLTCLTLQEVEWLKEQIWSDTLQKVVDAFLFMCHTGLHIGDYQRLTSEHVQTVRGQRMIVKPRMKAGKLRKGSMIAQVPLHPYASVLIARYGSVEDLPRMPDQRMNQYLKVIGERMDSGKKLTNITARKTFTNTAINHFRMSYEAVAGMLGHTSTRNVRHYGSVNEVRLLDEWQLGIERTEGEK